MKIDFDLIASKYKDKVKKLSVVDPVINNHYAVTFAHKVLKKSEITRTDFINIMRTPLKYSSHSMGPTQPIHWYYFCHNLGIDPYVIIDNKKIKQFAKGRKTPTLVIETLKFQPRCDPSDKLVKKILRTYINNYIPPVLLGREFGIDSIRFKSLLCDEYPLLVNCTEAYKIFYLFSTDLGKILDNPR